MMAWVRLLAINHQKLKHPVTFESLCRENGFWFRRVEGCLGSRANALRSDLQHGLRQAYSAMCVIQCDASLRKDPQLRQIYLTSVLRAMKEPMKKVCPAFLADLLPDEPQHEIGEDLEYGSMRHLHQRLTGVKRRTKQNRASRAPATPQFHGGKKRKGRGRGGGGRQYGPKNHPGRRE